MKDPAAAEIIPASFNPESIPIGPAITPAKAEIILGSLDTYRGKNWNDAKSWDY